ncbi:MAG: hypothetical protein PHZ11_10565 [Desulfitobacteriaceae bacterium]|nr:hypothetical protein [Desulfitobacteriaceae bacterium]MDD4347297.1 hypothetical protein [Desulfitobacteriaceae bacterium]
MAGAAYPYELHPPLPATPLSFSILVTSPIRCNLPFSPVSALILPLGKANLFFSGLIVAGLDLLTSFLLKRSLAHPPRLNQFYPGQNSATLTRTQLSQFMQSFANGQIPLPQPVGGNKDFSPPDQGLGPVGLDQPLFPDNLSVSLTIAAPFALFDGSPDTSFNVPFFELPGLPGNLIIALGLLIIQFLIERTGVGTLGCSPEKG